MALENGARSGFSFLKSADCMKLNKCGIELLTLYNATFYSEVTPAVNKEGSPGEVFLSPSLSFFKP